MKLADILMVCICDYAGMVRGKGFPVSERDARFQSGIGLAPTNLMITALGEILESPWGPRGELIMMPDAKTEIAVDLGTSRPPERLVLADILELDGTPWRCCPRSWLNRGLAALREEAGVQVNSAFEHEFHYSGMEENQSNAYSLDAVRLQGTFAHALLHALAENGIEPECFLPEYGPQQFEVTCKPAVGIEAADRAVNLREITRATARVYGHKATFSPVMAQGVVGNGVHIHFSLADDSGRPISFAPEMPYNVSATAGHFLAGILRDMPALVSLTAPSVVSYERLQPNRWSASFNNLADKDREAGIRICPLSQLPSSDQSASFNFEYRAADATASPYMALGALVWSGLQGIREKLPLPAVTDGDPTALSQAERTRHGVVRLPQSLEEALAGLESCERVNDWMGEEFLQAYLTHKRSEIKLVDEHSPEDLISRYVRVY